MSSTQKQKSRILLSKHTKVAVTGAAGFIGSHLVTKLAGLGCQVSAIDNFSRGSIDFLPKNKLVSIIKQDVTQQNKLESIFRNHDVVFNLAALNTGVDFDIGRSEVMFEENMLVQMIPLRAAQAAGISHFVQVSSASVYSKEAMEKHVPTPEDADTTNPEPSKIGYALAKKMGEQLAVWYHENTQLATYRVRFINVFGEHDHFDDMGHFIPMMIRKCVTATDTVSVFGSGNQKRSFLHVDDAVSAILTIVQKGVSGEVYNVDSNQEHTVSDVVKKIITLLNKKLSIVFDLTKPEGSQRRLLDATKLKKLGWQPSVVFEDGLSRTVTDVTQRLFAMKDK